MSPPSITTITSHVRSSHAIDMDLMEFEYPQQQLVKTTKKSTMISAELPFTMCDHKIYVRERFQEYQKKNGKWRKNFSNCRVFVVDVGGGKTRAIKYFKNGTMHVTGCKSEEEIREMCNEFLAKFAALVGMADKPNVTSVSMTMVNATCKYPITEPELDLYSLTKKLVDAGAFDTVTYDADRYFGIKTTCTVPQYKCNIFRTGTITLTGMTSPSQIKPAYDHIFEVLGKILDGRDSEEASPCNA